jgi:TolA-binding protein
MAFCRRWLLLLLVLALGGGFSFAAGSKKEERAYAAAVGTFNYGDYERAAAELKQFVEKYPASAHVPEAVLLQGQAEFKLGKFADAISLLTDVGNLARAEAIADEYVFWTGAAQLQGRDYADAAQTFIGLTQTFPKSRLRLRRSR